MKHVVQGDASFKNDRLISITCTPSALLPKVIHGKLVTTMPVESGSKIASILVW